MNGAGSPFISNNSINAAVPPKRDIAMYENPDDVKRRLEEENRILMQIVGDVKAELQKAATLSPTTSYATPL